MTAELRAVLERPVSARPSRFLLEAICLAGLTRHAGNPVSQSAGHYIIRGNRPSISG
jgi:hypothetical protein